MFRNKFVAILLLLVIIATLGIVGCKQNMLTEKAILKIANTEAEKRGHILESDNIYYDHGNKLWKEKLGYIGKNVPDQAERLKVLDNRKYQAVHYYPKDKMTLGGLLWIFVDKETGEVITMYGEK
jgi:hypothetical protein